jgi:hypothetical protein
MTSPLVYLANRFLYRIKEFFRHWYLNSFYIISHQTVNFLERLDRFLALRVTLRHWLKPLYQDYTFIGYFMGFFFRTFRILTAGVIYLIIIAAALALYIVWVGIPIYIVYRAW